MRKFVFGATFLSVVLLSGCGARISATAESTAKDAANKMTYAQDARTGLCFAFVSSATATHINDSSMSVTYVPCDQKVLDLIPK